MTVPVLRWHPRFNVYHYRHQGVLLLAEQESFWLSESSYPNALAFDGIKTVKDISDQLTVGQQVSFKQQYLMLMDHDMLVSVDDTSVSLYRHYRPSILSTLFETKGLQISSLSSMPHWYLAKWVDALTIIGFNDKRKHIYLVDDFLDTRLSSLLSHEEASLIIKIAGECVWFSPVYHAQSSNNLRCLQRQIVENQPVRQFVHTLFPDDIQAPPYKRPEELSVSEQAWIRQLALAQFKQMALHLISASLVDKKAEYHPVNPYYRDAKNFSVQANTPIQLSSSLPIASGASETRTERIDQTLVKLMPLVSAITGVINHLKPVFEESEGGIYHYSTGFFKTPPQAQGTGIKNDDFVQFSLGKGLSSKQAKVGAMCETLERYCAIYQGDEPTTFGQASDLESRYYTFQQLAPYSHDQYANFMDKTHPDAARKQAVARYDHSNIDWYPTWSLTKHCKVYIPFSCCFSGVPSKEVNFGRWSSNGCAAGNNLEEAIIHGLYELIERDAVGIWWYNQAVRPAYDLSIIDGKKLAPFQSSIFQSHHVWVLDVTTDVGVPVMVAVGQDKASGSFSLGFGCHLNAEQAALSALSELCQLMPIRVQSSAIFNFDDICDDTFLHASEKTEPRQSVASASKDIKQDIDRIVAQLQHLGLETIVLDYSRSHIPLSTANVFVPGLCHIWPQFANERLYNAPEIMQWQGAGKREAELNPLALYL